eukprot:6077851-Prymnesium_polylepis.1
MSMPSMKLPPPSRPPPPKQAAPEHSSEAFATPRGTRTVTLDTKYQARREALLQAVVDLPCGVTLSYFRDGTGGGVPAIAFHDAADSKWVWVMRKRIPGVDLVAVDRPGYGRSSTCESWEIQLLAYKELADLLGFRNFVAIGHGAGGAVG